MQTRNAYLCHGILVSLQPAYFALRWMLNPSYFKSASILWLTIALASWIFLISRISIPALTNPFRHLPAPRDDIFPIGHAWLLKDQPPPKHFARASYDTPNNGIVAFWDIFYLRARIILTTPETIMEAVNTRGYDWEKPGLAKVLLSRVLGQGLIGVEGDAHKAMRKTVAPAFSGRHIRDLFPLFWSKGLDFADSLARKAATTSDGEVELMNQMSRVTLDIIGAAGVGVDFDTINESDNKLARLYEIIISPNRGPMLLFFFINIFLPPWLVRRLRGTVYAKGANATADLKQSTRELIAEKKQNVKLSSAGYTDIIGIIMKSGNFSDEYLCDQLLTFLAAGHETTASALTWTSWLLAKHPDMQDRLRKECHEHLSRNMTTEISADTFDDMPYLTAVCNETLRLYPTAPLTARMSNRDTKIGDLHVPKGSHVVISPWVVNRDPALWGEDADLFRPERWIDGPSAASGGATSPYAFLTFLYGPRSCIGQGFARIEMKCILAALVLRFRLDLPPGGEEVKMGGMVTIKPKEGLKLKLYDLKDGNSSHTRT